jgi:predicted ATPase/two-component sensor histidine kinase
MISFPGYHATSEIYKSVTSIVYRAVSDSDNQPVIIKLLNEEHPSPEDLTRYRHEYEILRSLDLDGVVKAYGLSKYRNSVFILLEDFGGESLEILNLGGRLPQDQFLAIAIQCVDSLRQIHARNIIHKNVNPSNIVLNRQLGKLKLIDFGISTMLIREEPTVRGANVLEGTLAYISPEQTGRMNRAVDCRTDFYSLGVTFYELLTGKLPFDVHDDPLELVYCHIAKEPQPPDAVDPRVPAPLSGIVMKLLRKNADDRYRSTQGIKADLQECLRQISSGGRIRELNLAAQDISDRLEIPRKLYGRHEESKLLICAFDSLFTSPYSANAGTRGHVALISGYSGVGKTSLAHELHKPVRQRGGWLISGKFDQLQRDIPYNAIGKAFQELVHSLLKGSKTELAGWRERLMEALGSNARLMTDIIPALELIIGRQPRVSSLPPLEAQNRFNRTVQKFVGAFPAREHPLVIFLDDLQWADSASLNLIEMIATGCWSRYLLLAGSYRDNEVSSAHPLMSTLEAIRNSGAELTHISLSPLCLNDVTVLVSETLSCPLEEAGPLAELVAAKTDGNPFFVTELLRSLYREGSLGFDHKQGRWRWNHEEISARKITDDVVELLIRRILRLEPSEQEVVKLSGCIGNQFNLETLSIISERAPHETASSLKRVISEGLIHPVGNGHKLVELGVRDPLEEGFTVEYRFSHDRIQDAAYSLIPEDQRRKVHLQAGRLLRRSTDKNKLEKRALDIVNHLNQAVELMGDRLERDDLAELNLLAGKKAKSSAAYGPGLKYLETGIDILGEQKWERCYDLSLDLHTHAAEAALLATSFDKMEHLIGEVDRRARTVLDRVKAHEVKIYGEVARDRRKGAVDAALEILGALGMRIPRRPGIGRVFCELAWTRILRKGRCVEDLFNLPHMTDPGKLAATRMLPIVGPSAYRMSPFLAMVITVRTVKLSLLHGNSPASAYAYVAYGLFLCGVLGAFDSGYAFGRLALRMLEKSGSARYRANVTFVFNVHIRPFKDHIKESLEGLHLVFQTGLEAGDYEITFLGVLGLVGNVFMMGSELREVEELAARYSRAVEQLEHKAAQNMIQLYRQMALNLMGCSTAPELLAGGFFDEDSEMARLKKIDDKLFTFLIHVNKLILFQLFNEHSKGSETALEALSCIEAAESTIYAPLFYFWGSLNQLAIYPEVTSRERRRILKRVSLGQRRMKKWARHCPMNYSNKYYLVEAERARVLGRDAQAVDFYDRAIEAAGKSGFTHEEALANELAACYFLSRGKNKLARPYLADARLGYLKWGATAKVREMDSRFPPSAFEETGKSDGEQSTSEILHSTLMQDTVGTGTEVLDIASIIKASQTISGEIEVERLLVELIRIAMENAGAEKGFLILKTGEDLSVEASGSEGSLNSIPLEECRELSQAIVRYVSRTGETVILSDAAMEGPFTHDEYVLKNRPRSILCIPIVIKGSLTGLLYLENNLAPGVFTPDRVKVLQILSSQAAISIENVLLQQLRSALEEKEMLLREIHHRVKNNMQIISTLLKLQLKNTRDKRTRALFRDSQNRILSMAMIHEKLYQSKGLHRIDFRDYVRDLAHEALASFGEGSEKINLKIDIDDVSFGMDTAVPCGLIIIELLSNSLKYAFPKERKGNILVSLHSLEIDRFRLTVGDDGVGLPKDLDITRLESLGLRLVSDLARFQLGGKMELSGEEGTIVHVYFREKEKHTGQSGIK